MFGAWQLKYKTQTCRGILLQHILWIQGVTEIPVQTGDQTTNPCRRVTLKKTHSLILVKKKNRDSLYYLWDDSMLAQM